MTPAARRRRAGTRGQVSGCPHKGRTVLWSGCGQLPENTAKSLIRQRLPVAAQKTGRENPAALGRAVRGRNPKNFRHVDRFPHSSGTVLWTGCGQPPEKRAKPLITKAGIRRAQKTGSSRAGRFPGCPARFRVNMVYAPLLMVFTSCLRFTHSRRTGGRQSIHRHGPSGKVVQSSCG